MFSSKQVYFVKCRLQLNSRRDRFQFYRKLCAPGFTVLRQWPGMRNNKYRKVTNSSLSRLVARFQIFRRLMKGKFDAYVLWPLAKKLQNWIVDQSTARDFTVVEHSIKGLNTIEFLHRIPRNFWSDIQKCIRFKIRFEIFKFFLSKSDVTHLTSITQQPNLPLPACMPYLWTALQTQHGNFNPLFIT